MDTGDREVIYVAGYPKSGTTWLTRLIADALDCPAGGSTPEQDVIDVAHEGQDRPEPYFARKGHYVISDGVELGDARVVPAPHVLAWRNMRPGTPVFWIHRNPLDILVSASFYFRTTVPQFLDRMSGRGRSMVGIRSWNAYVRQWLGAEFEFSVISYERLHSEGPPYLAAKLRRWRLREDRVSDAWWRQTFEARRAALADKPSDDNRATEDRLLRRGIPGDWMNNLSIAELEDAFERFRDGMERLGYA